MQKAGVLVFKNSHIKNSSWQANFTVQEIAVMLNLTKVQVRKIEARALLNLRKGLRAKAINLNDLI